ncbi:hypothetical protein ABT002_26210 [Streptomyces goshikiensis]
MAERAGLTVFLLPAYSPGLKPVEGVWAHVERSLANLAVMALGRLERLQAPARHSRRPHSRHRRPSTTQHHPGAHAGPSLARGRGPRRLCRSPARPRPADSR